MMAIGVKKIKMVKGKYYLDKTQSLTTRVTIKPDQEVKFNVIEWLEGTSEEHKKEIYWLRQSNDRKIILWRGKGEEYTFKINKKLCGPYSFYVEASKSGKRDFKHNVGIYINGYTEPRIIKSEWRSEPDGDDIRQHPIAYGDIVYLWLETEGLSGDYISIEVYNNRSYFFDDTLIVQKKNIKVKEGEALYLIGDTNLWMAKVKNITDKEEFFIKAKDSKGKYIVDYKGQDIHARFLRANKKMSSNLIKPSENITPTKVFEPEVNAERFEPCKFDEIAITVPIVKDGQAETVPITVFKSGQKLDVKKSSYERINRSVHFNFNDYSISPDAQEILNNILGFLLEHKGTKIHMTGYACVIGKEGYNLNLSQKRSDSVKEFFVKGGLDPERINSKGKGEYNILNPDDYKKKNEETYVDARRVDISFNFLGHNANAIEVEVIAPSRQKNVTIDVVKLETEDCYRNDNKHKDEIIIKSDSYSKAKKGSSPSFVFPIQSRLSDNNVAPINYIWPKYDLLTLSDSAQVYQAYINSCRYFSDKESPAIIVKAYPDIKWELALEFLVNVSNYKAVNMPEGSVFARHQEKSRDAGYKRWLIGKQSKVPISIGVGLRAEWDEGDSKLSFTNEFSKKFEFFAKTISKGVNIIQNAVNYAQSAAKSTALPLAFDIRYPKFTVVGNWLLETNGTKDLSIVGTVGLGFKPLIGAEIIVDIIGAAIALASYAGTGNPAAARLINKFRKGAEKLGLTVTFTATFYGELSIMIDALKIDSVNGIDMQGKTTIGGEMGVVIELSMLAEFGKVNGARFIPIDASFKAAATAHGFFGGDFVIDSDEKGLFVQTTLKFSGVMLAVTIEGEVGWWKSSFKLEEKVVDGDSHTFEKNYLTDKETEENAQS